MRYLRPRILTLSLLCLCSWSSCSKTPNVVTLLDSHQLRPAYDAQCQLDPQRVTIDKGYLRELINIIDSDPAFVDNIQR